MGSESPIVSLKYECSMAGTNCTNCLPWQEKISHLLQFIEFHFSEKFHEKPCENSHLLHKKLGGRLRELFSCCKPKNTSEGNNLNP